MSGLDFSYACPAPCPGLHSRVKVCAKRLKSELPRLPFLSLDFSADLAHKLKIQTEWLRSYKHLLLLGIGGSALGALALQKCFAPGQDLPGHQGPWLWVADNADSARFEALLNQLPLTDTLVAVVSKSGSTVETLAQYLLVLPLLQKKLPGTWQEHLYIITDPEQGFLRAQATAYGLSSLPVPKDLGGRYSVLSAVGLAPAAFLGIDWPALVQGARQAAAPLLENPDALAEHPAWQMAVWAVQQFLSGKSQLIFFNYLPKFAGFNPWFAQLWAESLGKQGLGSLPVPALGGTDQHSLLQMFMDGPADKACLFLSGPLQQQLTLEPKLSQPWSWLAGKGLADILAAQAVSTRLALVEQGIPLLHLDLSADNEEEAGKLILLLEAATLFCGWLLEINPLDQPAVERGKLLAQAGLGAAGLEREQAALAAFATEPKLRVEF